MGHRTIPVRDTVWRAKVIESRKFKKLHGNCQAITLIPKKEIHFKTTQFTLNAVIHELVHAYFSTLYIDSANLSVNQYEEVIAQFLEDYIGIIHQQAKKLYRDLK